MFVLCPACAGPFRIPADQIAPLVQIACPHCAFRMILDFEAANDPALAERGQLFAQGFESAEAYFSVYSHIGPQAGVEPRPVAAQAVEAARPVEAPRPVEAARPVEAPRPVEVAQPKTPPTTPAPTPVSVQPQPAPTPAPTPVSAEPPPSTPPKQVGAKTIIQTPKKPASMEPSRTESVSASSGPSMRIGNRGAEAPEPVATEAKVTAVEPERRAPPHTPPAATAVSNAPAPTEPATTPKPEDIAAQSGSHPSKSGPKPAPVEDAATKPADGEKKPVAQPPETGGSNVVFIAVVLVVVIAIAIALYLNMK